MSFDIGVVRTYGEPMTVHLTPELEAKLAAIATRTGRPTEELVETAVMRFVDEEVRFMEAVDKGFASLDRGEFVSHEEVGQRLERILRS